MGTTDDIVAELLSSNQRTAALDEIVDKFKRHAKSLEEQKEVYSEVVGQCLDFLTNNSAGMSDSEKLMVVRELLGSCHSGRLLQEAKGQQVTVFEPTVVEGIAMDDTFVVS